jgi:hypothetical protein
VSDTSQGPGWWLASDGMWYPPETAPPPPPPPPGGASGFASRESGTGAGRLSRRPARHRRAPGFSGAPPDDPPPADKKPVATRWWFWTVIVLVLVMVAAGIAVGIRKNDSNSPGASTTHAAGASTTTPHRPRVTTTSAPSTTSTTKYVPPTAFFSCSGSAPGGVGITYGTNSSSHPGGTSLPWEAYLPVTPNIEFFDVSAHFQGSSGSIRCRTLVYVNGKSVAQIGTASESHDIASAKVCSTSAGTWRPC